MKWLILSVLSLASIANAAGTYECDDTRGRRSNVYTIVTSYQAAVVALAKPAANDISEVEYFGTGKPITWSENDEFTFDVDKTTKVDWKKEKKCYAFAGDTYRFVVAGENSSVTKIPNIDYKPNVACMPPVAMRLTVNLKCRELEAKQQE